MSETEKIKPTDRIKERLRRYGDMLRDIENQRERLEHMTATYGTPSGPDLSGMPRPQGGISNPTAAAVERKIKQEEKIRRKEAEAEAEYTAIENMTEQLDDPDERLTIQLRYLDRAEWPDVNFALFGSRPDFTEKVDAYQRRTFRLHGRALLNLARIAAEPIDSKAV